LTLLPFTVGLNPFERRNRAQNVAPVIATLTADRLQQQQPKHMFFKETARAGAISYVEATIPAVKFLEKPAPRGPENGSHGLPPGQNHSNPQSDAKLRWKLRPKTDFALTPFLRAAEKPTTAIPRRQCGVRQKEQHTR
jgi:hypothetical protein